MAFYRIVLKLINPEEARPTAEKLEKLAGEVRSLSVLVKETAKQLDETWDGGAKGKYIQPITALHEKLDRYALNMESKAGEIKWITFWAEFKEKIEDITPWDDD